METEPIKRHRLLHRVTHVSGKAHKRLTRRLAGVTVKQTSAKGYWVYRLVVPGFATRKKALEYRDRVLEKGFKGAWVGRS